MGLDDRRSHGLLVVARLSYRPWQRWPPEFGLATDSADFPAKLKMFSHGSGNVANTAKCRPESLRRRNPPTRSTSMPGRSGGSRPHHRANRQTTGTHAAGNSRGTRASGDPTQSPAHGRWQVLLAQVKGHNFLETSESTPLSLQTPSDTVVAGATIGEKAIKVDAKSDDTLLSRLVAFSRSARTVSTALRMDVRACHRYGMARHIKTLESSDRCQVR